ncbi:alpha/beta fold hydrolase [Micromonospora soli]|uniref:alpha/beta hydrolase family protein n=1 Tax=Micromonospora sp. NBRC 110009 TaxID=3061627 RepID=UPI002670D691|nr:alpha/beta fold hydrolase [Micromonospora sp. NBRC 110009]WKT98712.1 alpha/beta fold hydrolase [Micromonospora sp. NBRC 110009]
MPHLDEGAGGPTPVVSVSPVVLPAPGRGEDLQVRVSAPTTGHELPIIVFSHGFGWSMNGYAPLVDFWAARGFVVVQPTHLDSRTLNITPDDPRYPEIWRFRVADLRRILDQLDLIDAAVPGLSGRLDRSRIAAAGHSWGGQTASMLLGARVLDADGVPGEDMSDSRVKVAVLLSTTGTGGADLSPFAAEHFPFMSPSFADMTTPALVIAGDKDQSPLTVRGPDWFTDSYHLSPGPKSLLTLFEAEHSLGGIPGYTVTETTDENPERVAWIQRLTWAYLRSALYPGDVSWAAASAELTNSTGPLGRIESK